MFWMDYWYIVLVLPALAISLFAQLYVNKMFNKYSSRFTHSGMTGEQVCHVIQRANGISVPVESVSGSLTDHYDPRNNTIRLSQPVYGSSSIAAVGVAAHEMGHALQYAKGYAPVRLRTAVFPATRLISGVSPFLILLGLLLSNQTLALTGVIAFGAIVLFQLVTLPVEFNASRRAVASLSNCGLTQDELRGVKQVLTAAAMTYVAALLVSIAQFLRLLLIVTGNGRRRR